MVVQLQANGKLAVSYLGWYVFLYYKVRLQFYMILTTETESSFRWISIENGIVTLLI